MFTAYKRRCLMKCWYCMKNTMEQDPDLGNGWFKCSNCKATWIKIGKLGQLALGSTYKGPIGMTVHHPNIRRRVAMIGLKRGQG